MIAIQENLIHPKSIGPALAPTSPWRSGRWVFGAVWLFFMVYPAIGIVTSDGAIVEKVFGMAMISAFAVIYLLLCVYSMFVGEAEEKLSPATRTAAVAILVALMVASMPLLKTSAFAMAPFVMAAIAFAAPWKGRYALIGIVTIIAAAVAVPEFFGWELDSGFLIVMIIVGITMLFSRVMRDAQRDRETVVERQRALNAQLAVVAERERVARDVHDILGHSLTVITVKSELAGRLVDLDPGRAKTEIDEVTALAREALAEVRSTVGNLRTPDLTNTIAAAESALAAAGITADLPHADGYASTIYEGPHATLFAWVLREATTNVVRHSGATRCEVTISTDAITISDDGRGSPVLTYGNGLRGLAERVEAEGGRLTVSSDATGTTVAARFDDR
ncbi:sensor histidine kinase [Gordonia sp. (in: high G+C Gram-positive bacteria)]|uniref:sensor histidine kinase n=1 Tax=Gordonia sp. (in: high G+C Gram-positive bacteria) TaxID=84139 RepID=UPI003C70FA72